MISDALAVMKIAGVIMAVRAPYVVGSMAMATRRSLKRPKLARAELPISVSRSTIRPNARVLINRPRF
jgi:hypothetical protein